MRIIKAARGRITSSFGATNVPGANVPRHLGMDLGHGNMTAADLQVWAPAAGKVTAVGWQGTYGLRVVIDHGNGWTSLLAHLSDTHVEVGEWVTERQLVATMGGTGGSWPVHLHQELRRNGTPVDPELYLAPASAPASPTPPTTLTNHLEDHTMFIANVSGSFYLVMPQGTGQPRAVVLGRDSGAAASGLPVLTFTAKGSVDQLKAAVAGI